MSEQKIDQRLCGVEGCLNRHYAHEYSHMHCCRWQRNGDPTKLQDRGKARHSFVKDDIGYIDLGNGEFALVDAQHFQRINMWKWRTHADMPYAARKENDRFVLMQHSILPKKKGFMVDHENRNKKDNRERNLRYLTRSQNSQNSGLYATNKTGYRGVSWLPSRQKFRAVIYHNGKRSHLGCFDKAEHAAQAYIEAAKRLGFVSVPDPPSADAASCQKSSRIVSRLQQSNQAKMLLM